VPVGPTMSISSARDSAARMSSASFASASTVTRPCCETTDRYIRLASNDLRALSLGITDPPSRYVDDHRLEPERQVLLILDEKAPLLDPAFLARERAHLGAVFGTLRDRAARRGDQLCERGLPEIVRDEHIRTRFQHHALVLPRQDTAG